MGPLWRKNVVEKLLLSAIAIIPARGGSKRIPRKNLKLFDGVPMILRSIRIALASRLFDDEEMRAEYLYATLKSGAELQ